MSRTIKKATQIAIKKLHFRNYNKIPEAKTQFQKPQTIIKKKWNSSEKKVISRNQNKILTKIKRNRKPEKVGTAEHHWLDDDVGFFMAEFFQIRIQWPRTYKRLLISTKHIQYRLKPNNLVKIMEKHLEFP